MSKLEENPNIETQMISRVPRFVYSCFVIISSFVIRLPRRSPAKAGHSSFA
jgi:hypothetical protein